MLEGEHVEVGLPFRAQRDQVGEDEFVALAHGWWISGSISAWRS
jgi:hypothetical protein